MNSYDDNNSGHETRLTPRNGLRLVDIERNAVERALRQTGNNQSAAARMLGIARPTLIRKLKTYRMMTRQQGP